jgi:hypothetical protein
VPVLTSVIDRGHHLFTSYGERYSAPEEYDPDKMVNELEENRQQHMDPRVRFYRLYPLESRRELFVVPKLVVLG